MDRRRFVQLGVGAAAVLLVPEFRPSLWALDQTMIYRSEPRRITFPSSPLVGENEWGSVEWQVNEWHLSDEGIMVIDDAKITGYSVRPVAYDIRATLTDLEPDQAWIGSATIELVLL